MSQTTKEFGPITVDGVYVATNQKAKSKTAQLRQVVTVTFTPEVTYGDDMSDDLASPSDFGNTSGEPEVTTENRVAFRNVPEDWDKTKVEESLAANPNARLFKVLSYNVKDIMTQGQKDACEGTSLPITYNDFANLRGKAIRYGNGPNKDELILHNGFVQYRGIFYDKTGQKPEMVDKRNPENVFLSPELETELAGAVAQAY